MIRTLLAELLAEHDHGGRIAHLTADSRLRVAQIWSRWEGRVVWTLFTRRCSAPVMVVKADHNRGYQQRLRREHQALQAVSQRPELRGTVPEPLTMFTTGPRLVLAQTGLPGTPLTVRARQRIRPSPRRSAAEHRQLLDWLERLQGGGGQRVVVDADKVLEQAAAAIHGDDEAAGFLSDLRAMAADWSDLTLPLLPGHGDLAPSNCLLHGGQVRVIDWEGGVGTRTPLADLIIFLNHYARCQPETGYLPPVAIEAFRRAFLGHGWLAALTARSFERHIRYLGLPVAAREYLLVATLTELATGEASTAHATRAKGYWTTFLRAYAAGRRSTPTS
ncbi:MAG: hypothetical protein ACRDU8_01190 [Egibacteraceae bacterium]